jgi:hypothetical protein
MKNDVAEYRRRNFSVLYRTGDYDYLMSILTRHIAMMTEKFNNAALCQAIGKAGKSVPATPVIERKDPCKFWESERGCSRGDRV